MKNFIFLIVWMTMSSIALFAQESLIEALTPKSVVEKTTCFTNSNEMEILNYDNRLPMSAVIIVSHLGIDEKVNVGKRRLNNAKIFLSKERDPQYGRSLESIVVAEGDRSKDKGFVDFFVGGQLELRIFLPKNRDLLVQPCVGEPEQKECATKLQRLFYPCKKG